MLRRASSTTLQETICYRPATFAACLCRDFRWVGFYGQLEEGHRPAHGSIKPYLEYHNRATIGFCMLAAKLESETDDRAGWRAACFYGESCFGAERSRLKEPRRARRREGGEICNDEKPNCRRCKSCINLFSYIAGQPWASKQIFVVFAATICCGTYPCALSRTTCMNKFLPV